MVEFKEANLSEVKQLFEVKDTFHLWPKAELSKEGKVDIYSTVAGEEGEMNLEHSFSKEHNSVFIAKSGKKIVGYMFVSIYPNRSAQPSYFSMAKNYSGKGIGKQMVEWVNQELAKRKVRIVNFISKHGAIDFYERKTEYKRRNPNTKRPKHFWSPGGRIVTFGLKPKLKAKEPSRLMNLLKRFRK
ncbi:MAG: GNAT family N-acetyltransferase [archaeon]|jgi:GNAT superfamily N-acetyltransferase